jgi:hypothetical protein
MSRSVSGRSSAVDYDLRLRSLIDRYAFWHLFDTRHPLSGPWSLTQPRNRQKRLDDIGLIVSIYLSEREKRVGVFFGGGKRLNFQPPHAVLTLLMDRVRERLEEQPWISAPSHTFHSIWKVDLSSEYNWPAMCDWLVTEAARFEDAVRTSL